MSRFLRITSRQNEVVARYRAVARGDDAGLLLLDGVHLISDAVAAGLVLHHVMIGSELSLTADARSLLDRLSNLQVDIAEGSQPVMAAASPVRTASPIVALARRPHPARQYQSQPALVVIACDVQDPGNIGAMVRVAEAAGGSGLVAAGHSANPFGWKALRGSMGSALRLPVTIARRVEEAVDEARRQGCRIVATVPRGGEALFAATLTGPLALLVGGEGPGLSPELVQTADQRITIPMQAPVESLNCSVTAALALYEALRQRAPRN
jgi:RNA methyltransferase, TrmH family